jgi:predicted kinase
MCGLPCSGKTTLARQLERERNAVRLTPDEWIVQLFGADVSEAVLDAARHPVEALMWDLAARLLVLGVDVILDFGLWSRRERDEFRARAAKLGADSELHYLDVPLDVLLTRLAARNSNPPPGAFRIDAERLRGWASRFEQPTVDEVSRY